MSKLRDNASTDDYRKAMSGEGDLGLDWKDKPHRLVYDLCNEVDRLQEELRIARGVLTPTERHRQDFLDGTFEHRQDNA